MKFTANTSCKNSPKREFIKNLNKAFAEANIDEISKGVTDDIIWKITGDKSVYGKSNFINSLKAMQDTKISEFIVDKIISHGKDGSANGTIISEDGSKYEFADIYEFSNTKGVKIKFITSYVIKIE